MRHRIRMHTVAAAAALVPMFLIGAAAGPVLAQKGTGEREGVARQAVKPEVATLSGKLVEIRTGQCESAAGRSPVGTHLIVATPEGKKLDVHLGPADAVAGLVASLSIGQEITMEAFRTDRHKAADFVARSIRAGENQIELRDAAFRPFWAAGAAALQPPGPGPGIGMGRGRGSGMGMGMGMGRGPRANSGCCGMGPGGGGAWGKGGRGGGPGAMGMSAAEHDNVLLLLNGHESIRRTVEEIPGGVRTTTTTSRPELVEILRSHVRQMARHLEEGRPVRMWDPLFREVFAHRDAISLTARDIEGGIEVTETSDRPEVVPLIRAHARKVDEFAAAGHTAARPPWAGGRGRLMRGR